MSTPITTSVQICNAALIKMGSTALITALSQSTRAAIVCNQIYAPLRDEVMGSAPWRFATKRAVLAPTGVDPAFTYTYMYDIPDDCLRPLVPDDDKIIWVQEGSTILTNETTLNLKYLYRNVDESSWDARFCDALSWRLAMELALALAQSIPMQQAMEKGYDKSIAQARAMNAVIGVLPPLEADVWSDARKGNNRFRPTVGQVT